MARNFEFRLEALLTHRTQVEKEKQRATVGRVQQEIQAVMRQIQETQARIAEENGNLSARELHGKLDMQYIAYEKKYVGNLQVRIVLAMQKRAQLEVKLSAARAELLVAARARKVIEKLREKQWARWRADQERKEAAVMDEIGTQLALRHAAAEIEESARTLP